MVKENKLCRQCLNSHRRIWFSKKVCDIANCKAKHLPLLHKYSVPAHPSNGLAATSASSGSVNSHSDPNNKPCFWIIPICIHNNGSSLNTFAFLDEGSSFTLMKQSLYIKLGLSGEKAPSELRWTGDTTRCENNSFKMNIEVSYANNNSRFTLYDVRTVHNLGLPIQSINVDDIVKDCQSNRTTTRSSIIGELRFR